MNDNHNLTTAEEKLASIIWQKAPIASPALVDIAWETLGWKKSTTYTVLRKLCEKGVFTNNNALVETALTREQLTAMQSRRFVNSSCGGSLPAFIAAFASGKKLSPKEAKEIKALIDSLQEDNK